MQEHERAMNKAKIQLMSKPDSAFFTTVCFNLKHVWSDKIPTAATNGKEILYNPDFFMKHTTEQQVGLIMHETMHVVFQHLTRRGSRNPKKWNYAGDYVINQMLRERNFQLPEPHLYDPKYEGWSTDEVYDDLPEEMDQPDLDDLLDAAASGLDPDQLQADIDDILVRASIQSKMAGDKPGTIPGEVEIHLDKLLNPKLPWDRILAKYLRAQIKSDYSFRRPNRRFFPKHYLPSQTGEGLVNIAWAVDASASVTDEQFQQFISEGATIMRQLKPKKLTLVQFDTRIRSVEELRSLSDIHNIQFAGRGGTNVHPVMEWAKERKPTVLLVFTDGEFGMPADPGVPIIWIITDNPQWQPPFGRVVHYDTQQR